jgi:predicted negative regulator of RcsB-dependent stress response
MAKHLDLEEQEQLAELKHFWSKYGNLITWVLIAVFGSVAAYNGWNWWQRNQAVQASALYDEVERAADSRDLARVQRAFGDVRDQYGRTTYAQQGGLLAARAFQDAGKLDEAKAALRWVADKASDEGYQAIARLRLAALLADSASYDEALSQLGGRFPASFTALVADRRGDVLNLQGKTAEAKAEYQKALAAMDAGTEYRRLIEVKLAALGGKPLAAPDAGGAGRS